MKMSISSNFGNRLHTSCTACCHWCRSSTRAPSAQTRDLGFTLDDERHAWRSGGLQTAVDPLGSLFGVSPSKLKLRLMTQMLRVRPLTSIRGAFISNEPGPPD